MPSMSTLTARVALVLVSLASLGCQHSPSGGGGPGEGKGNADDGTPRACTEMACHDSATITTKLSAAGAPLGTHAFALEIDGVAKTCTVEFVAETETADGKCSDGVQLVFGPAMQGKELAMDGVVGYTEEPIPGEFRWALTMEGQPAQVHVIHTHEGRTIVDQSASLIYSEYRPNGAGCEPVCHNAQANWVGA